MKSINHIAIIMDGNGRWAKAQGKIRTAGHLVGAENVRTIAIAANRLGVKHLTLYAFSTENWQRSQEEVSYIMKLPAIFFKKYMKEFIDRGFRMEIIGELEQLPKSTKEVLLEAEEESKQNKGLHLSICMNYGGQSETVIAAKRYAKALQENPKLELTMDNFHEFLLTKNLPPVDLMIRTGGEERISNYLPWQLAYAELMFVQESWPEFSEEVLKNCIEKYKHRDRRFGGVKE
ncbi:MULTISPECIES: polyprenyl diphosphate synthase [Terrabacteria group]|uniref:polyprenyl diphosphate synthase n=1 Tax=Bacillati TaxID=1783272 RepID=UPI001C6E445B|nr:MULTISPECIES: polyprenyl diphosphate synthase [Terrabacteria group]MBW9212042.1 di-trans,poly-cis-decaprenylcistransferase [Trueperella sp. zg.1013]